MIHRGIHRGLNDFAEEILKKEITYEKNKNNVIYGSVVNVKGKIIVESGNVKYVVTGNREFQIGERVIVVNGIIW